MVRRGTHPGGVRCYWPNAELPQLPLLIYCRRAVHSNLDHNFILESKKIQDNQLSRKSVAVKELATSFMLCSESLTLGRKERATPLSNIENKESDLGKKIGLQLLLEVVAAILREVPEAKILTQKMDS